jgi:hypothetical protein
MKKTLFCFLAILLAVGVGARIWYVNATAAQEKIETYNQSEWVPLDGNFQDNSDEKTQGYSVCVQSAKLITYEDFIKRYKPKEDPVKPENRPKHLIDLTIGVKNDHSTGYLSTIQTYLQYQNDILMMDPDLWGIMEPKCKGALSLKLKPDSQASIHIPYPPNLQEEKEQGNYLRNQDYYLVVSEYPIKKMIHVNVEK